MRAPIFLFRNPLLSSSLPSSFTLMSQDTNLPKPADWEQEKIPMADEFKPLDTNSKDIFQKPSRPVTLKFIDVVYKINVRSTHGYFFKKKTKATEREILRRVSGIVKPGEMLAMLGPSGSGKTTLLTALGGRLDGHLTGSITYNGKPYSSQLKRRIGFVTQDDVFYANLTVTETLVYAALLRLPNSMSKEQKVRQAEAVIDQLNLAKCKNTIIGGPFLRGVSGGERKRVSIGHEMLINPSLLFLDEPTSGLDSTTARMILSTLSELTKAGRTIVTTIHQPSSKMFYMFDKVMLLSDGNPLYFGKGGSVMEYFKSVGFAPLRAMNPADFLLDIANGISPDDSVDDRAVVKSRLVSAYKEHLEEQVRSECEEFDSDVAITKDKCMDKDVEKWATTWCQQFWILLRRGLKERRHESFSKLRIIQIFAIAIISGLLWWRSDNLQDQVGLLFFYATFWAFIPLYRAIFAFPPERQMIAKERSSGMYRLSSYYLSRMATDLPMELVLPAGFVIIVYFMAGLKCNPQAFFYNLSSLLFSVLVSQGLGLTLGAFFLNQKNATVLGSVLVLSFMLSGGFFVQNVPAFIAWIKYLSVMMYTFRLLLNSQFDQHDTYACGSGKCLVSDFPSIRSIGMGKELFSVLMLLLLFLFYRCLAYVALMRIGARPR